MVDSIVFPIITAALCIFFIYAYCLVLRFNLHMLQLNGYKNNEQKSWLKKNSSKQKILYPGIVLGLLFSVIISVRVPLVIFIIISVLSLAYFILIITLYNFYRKSNTKKKLVYTPRVKRLICTNVIISLVIMIIFSLLLKYIILCGLFLLIVCLQPIMVVLANRINKPIEKSISDGFVRDAKRILKANPNLIVIGITGSFGKTSVKYYLNTLLREHFNVLMTPGSFNTPMGVVRTIREQLKPTHNLFICEMGARYVNDIKEICDIVHPMHGIITSIGPQHLETFINMENIVNTKFELADAVKGKGLMFLNSDNEFISKKADEYDNAIFFGKESTVHNGYSVKNVSYSNQGTEFTITAPSGEEETFNMRLIGEHNIVNAAGAIAIAHSLGIEFKKLKVPVRRLESAPHRLELIKKGNVTIIDDAFNSNPVGSKAAVETLSAFEGTRILVTPGMVELGDKEDEFNYKFGTYAADCADYILLVGKKHTQPILNGALSKGFDSKRLQVFDRLEEALTFAYSINENKQKYILLENDLPDNY